MSKILAIESWILYVVGICLIFSRLASRLLTFGSVWKLQYDDWLMLVMLIPFTGTIVSANQTSAKWESPDVSSRIWGLRMKFALEEFHLTTTWLVKGCLIILYNRILVSNKPQRRVLASVTFFCLLSFLVAQILLTAWCQPVYEYWDPASPNPQCHTYHSHALTTLPLNLLSTLLLLVYPIPFIPTPRKFLLGILLLLGSLVLATGLLSRIYLLTQPAKTTYIPWATAEAALAIYFANLPFLSPLFTSATHPSHIRHLRSKGSLSKWPQSSYTCRNPRANSTATMATMTSPVNAPEILRVDAHTLPPLRTQRLNSAATTSTISSPTEADALLWTLPGCLPDVPPPTPVRTLSPADPPPELESYCESRRPSTRGADLESLFKEPDWPLK